MQLRSAEEDQVTILPKPFKVSRAPKPLRRGRRKRSRQPEALRRHRMLEKLADKLWALIIRETQPRCRWLRRFRRLQVQAMTGASSGTMRASSAPRPR